MTRLHGAWVSLTVTGVAGTYKLLDKVNTCYINIMVAIEKGAINKDAIQRQISEQKIEFMTLKAECQQTHDRQNDRIERYIVNK